MSAEAREQLAKVIEDGALVRAALSEHPDQLVRDAAERVYRTARLDAVLEVMRALPRGGVEDAIRTAPESAVDQLVAFVLRPS